MRFHNLGEKQKSLPLYKKYSTRLEPGTFSKEDWGPIVRTDNIINLLRVNRSPLLHFPTVLLTDFTEIFLGRCNMRYWRTAQGVLWYIILGKGDYVSLSKITTIHMFSLYIHRSVFRLEISENFPLVMTKRFYNVSSQSHSENITVFISFYYGIVRFDFGVARI